jgi:Fur family transcriptional regulator, peroxide stress response regulator
MNLEPNAQKLRYSKQREQIYKYLLNSKEHPSADMIYKGLFNDVPNLSLATVYRNLRLLEELGKIQCVAIADNAERYDARCDVHAHFVCTKCGAVKDLDSIDMEGVKNFCSLGDRVSITGIKLVIDGLCENCIHDN